MNALWTVIDWGRAVDRVAGARGSVRLAVSVVMLCVAGAIAGGAPATWAAGTLYATSFGSRSEGVYAFAISADGDLRALSGSPFTAGRGTNRVAITPDGRHLYVSNWLIEGTVTALSIAADGSLSPVLGSPFAAAEGTWGMVVSPDGKHLYAANEGVEGRSNDVSAYSIAADGGLTAVPGSPFPAGRTTWEVAITPDGRHLYVINGEYNEPNADVSAYTIASNGGLTPVAGSPFAAGQAPEGVAITPDARHLYVVNGSSNDVSAFAIAADGGLTAVPGSPVAAGSSPKGAAISPDGKYLYVVEDGLPCDVRAFSIGADGSLTPLAGSPFPTHTYKPIDVAVSRDGKHLFVTSFGYAEPRQGAGWISAFSIAADGGLSAAPGSPFPTERAIGVAAGPDLAPAAAFSATPAPAGSASSFDASASHDLDGGVDSYRWDFGDGQGETTTSPTTSHTYAAAGDYTATVTVTDESGCSTTQIFSGNTLICDGSPLAQASHQVTVPTPARLSVELSGSGSGTLTSSPSGITCPGTCSYVYAAGTQVTLAITPASGSIFTGWSGGGCSGAAGSCQVALSSDAVVTATFEKLPSQATEETPTSPQETPTTPAPLHSVLAPPLVGIEASLQPSLQYARQSASRWRERGRQAQIGHEDAPTGTTFSFSLNEPATVSFTFNQLLAVHRGDHGCVAKSHDSAQRDICTYIVRRGTLSFAGKNGPNHVRFAGDISRSHELRPGRYDLVISAANSAGQRSGPVTLGFTIVR